jgi:hypothetical protein
MALGAWGGVGFVAEVAVLAILLGGAMAAGLLAFKGRLPDFTRRMRRFILTLLIRELEPEAPVIDSKFTMPFGIPIAVAAVWTAIAHPLATMGLLPWI